NAFGLSALHLATWRNHLPIVRRLLDAGADPDARDGESGWSSLHRALHFGHLCIASVLLQFGASLALEDTKGRTPVDLISCPVSQANGDFPDAVATEVFSWGSGTNYQLGTGNVHIQKLPCKVEALHGSYIKTVAASKFHSVAVSSNGELYTWGFGRGGRLGHPDIHSGQTTAVITPRQVTVGLGRKRVSVVAAAKHHTVIATELGNCLPGDQIEGQLGYPSVHTQPTPRRVGSLKQRIISVAAANKHSTAVADTGEVLTCGCNKEGQLGYSTSNLASNCIPRMVEYLKGKVLRGVSAAKYHTIVLGADGEFHRMERLQVISVAAGTTHSTALTTDGMNGGSDNFSYVKYSFFLLCFFASSSLFRIEILSLCFFLPPQPKIALANALYSDSVLDLDTVACFFACHDTRLFPKNTAKPPVDLLSSGQTAQSTSEYALTKEENDLFIFRPSLAHDLRYLNILLTATQSEGAIDDSSMGSGVDTAVGSSESSALLGALDVGSPTCVREVVVGPGNVSWDDSPGSDSWADTLAEVLGDTSESPWGSACDDANSCTISCAGKAWLAGLMDES
ncbi:hypothetical protein ACJX0J_021351, partial [Zea mays]